MKKAVILMNMGGARSPQELKVFLFNMFSDKRIVNSWMRFFLARIIPPLRYKKVWKNYELINGSRIYDITEKLCEKLSVQTGKKVLYSMRYTKPFLNELIHNYDEVHILPLYPQYSTTTVESALDELKLCNFKGKTSIIKPFYKDNAFNKLLKNKIKNSIEKPADWHLIFSAHGLPQKIIKQGDPYQKQVEEQVNILKKILPDFKSISLAYQSKIGPSKWLEPALDKTLENYKNERVLIYPLSFIIDNSETDLELKVEYAHLAKTIGLKEYQVVECPNDTDDFVTYLAGKI
jgi:ferrochelatase